VIFAAIERQGRMRAKVIGTSESQAQTARAARATLHEFVLPKSMVFTDEFGAYNAISHRYTHRRIRHSQRIYVSGEVHTNTVEGFFGHFKTDPSRDASLGLAQVAQRLPERVGLEVESPERRRRDVSSAARQRGYARLGLVAANDLFEVGHDLAIAQQADLRPFSRLLSLVLGREVPGGVVAYLGASWLLRVVGHPC
jgi:hypothetical protein